MKENENKVLIEAERIVSEYIAKIKTDENEDILLYSRPKRSARKKQKPPLLLSLSVFSALLFFGILFFCR